MSPGELRAERRPLGRGPVVMLGLAGAAIALIAAGRPWVDVAVGGFGAAGGPVIELSPSGRVIAPAVAGLALLGLAAAAALIVTTRLVRALSATLLLLAGVVIVVSAARSRLTLQAAVRPEVAEAVGRTGLSPVDLTATPWPWVAAAGGVVMVAAGVAALLRGGRWPGMSRRYERAPEAAPEPEDMWAAQDRGQDPTA